MTINHEQENYHILVGHYNYMRVTIIILLKISKEFMNQTSQIKNIKFMELTSVKKI